MVQFKKEFLEEQNGIICTTEEQAQNVVAWYHVNGLEWQVSLSYTDTCWDAVEGESIIYGNFDGWLTWCSKGLYMNKKTNYEDALLLPNDSYTCYGKSFYERIEKMIDEKLKDYQKIEPEPEPEPEFTKGDLVKFNVRSAPGYGIVREVVDDEYIFVEYFFQKMRWFKKDNLIKIGCEE